MRLGDMSSKRTCTVCGKSEGKIQVCGTCKKVSYCSKQHQKKDWGKHKLICKPPKPSPFIKPTLKLSNVKYITPENVGVNDEIYGKREKTPTSEFLESVKNSKVHFDGKLPPPSKTFPRLKECRVVVYHRGEFEKEKVKTWEYYNIDDYTGEGDDDDEEDEEEISDYDSKPIINKFPPKITSKDRGVIIILCSGDYKLRKLNYFCRFETVDYLEIIGEENVTIKEDTKYIEFGLHGFKNLRIANITFEECPCDGLFHCDSFIELDGVDICELDDLKEYPGSVVKACNILLFRDCNFHVNAGLSGSLGREETVILIHCSFINCSELENREYFDPYYHSPILQLVRYANACIFNCHIDRDTKGHLIYRRNKMFPDLGDDRLLQLLQMFNPNPQAAIAKLHEQDERPMGKTILHKNRIDSEICEFCDILLYPENKDSGISCPSSYEDTLEKQVEGYSIKGLKNFQKEKSNMIYHIDDDDGGNENLKDLKLCIARWNLRAPYCLRTNWKKYYEFRDRLENTPTVDDSCYYSDDNYEILEEDDEDDQDNPHFHKQTRIKRNIENLFLDKEITGDTAYYWKRKPSKPKSECLYWTPKKHFEYPDYFKESVKTLLLCVNRKKQTDGGFWFMISIDVFEIIFNFLAKYSVVLPLANSAYLHRVFFNWEDYESVRTLEAKGTLFSPIGNGTYVRFQLNYHMRYRMSFIEQFSGVELFVPKQFKDALPLTDYDNDLDKHFIIDLFKKFEKTTNTLHFELISENQLLFLCEMLFGNSNAFSDLYSPFRILFHACGGSYHKGIDFWPLNYAEKKYRELLEGEEYDVECPPIEVFNFTSSDDSSDDEMWF